MLTLFKLTEAVNGVVGGNNINANEAYNDLKYGLADTHDEVMFEAVTVHEYINGTSELIMQAVLENSTNVTVLVETAKKGFKERVRAFFASIRKFITETIQKIRNWIAGLRNKKKPAAAPAPTPASNNPNTPAPKRTPVQKPAEKKPAAAPAPTPAKKYEYIDFDVDALKIDANSLFKNAYVSADDIVDPIMRKFEGLEEPDNDADAKALVKMIDDEVTAATDNIYKVNFVQAVAIELNIENCDNISQFNAKLTEKVTKSKSMYEASEFKRKCGDLARVRNAVIDNLEQVTVLLKKYNQEIDQSEKTFNKMIREEYGNAETDRVDMTWDGRMSDATFDYLYAIREKLVNLITKIQRRNQQVSGLVCNAISSVGKDVINMIDDMSAKADAISA